MKTVSCLFVVLALVMAPCQTASAATRLWIGADGAFWSTPTVWNPNGIPLLLDDVVMGTQFAATQNVTANFNVTLTGAGLNSLVINSTGIGGIFTLSQTVASAMIATTETIGSTISGNVYTQSAGTNTTNTLYLGFGNGAFGNYNLSSTGTLNAVSEYIGFAGTGGGVFTQSGGTNNVTS